MKVKGLHNLVFEEVKKNFDVLLSTTRTLIEDIRAFNVEYKEELNKKNEFDGKLLKGIGTPVNKFQVELSKVVVSSKPLIS